MCQLRSVHKRSWRCSAGWPVVEKHVTASTCVALDRTQQYDASVKGYMHLKGIHAFAPQYSFGGERSGVKTMTSSPWSFKFRIRHSNLFFIPDICENGLGSTNMAMFLASGSCCSRKATAGACAVLGTTLTRFALLRLTWRRRLVPLNAACSAMGFECRCASCADLTLRGYERKEHAQRRQI